MQIYTCLRQRGISAKDALAVQKGFDGMGLETSGGRKEEEVSWKPFSRIAEA